MDGDSDIGAVAAVIGEPARARVLMALGDGRALPATVLAAEAGVAASTASTHLARLVDAGLLRVRIEGRHRYYELAGPQVAAALEALARIAPAAPVRSLKQGTKAHAVRRARTCYDHLAGRLGVGLMSWLLQQRALVGHGTDAEDRLAAPGQAVDYELGPEAPRAFAQLGIDLPEVLGRPRRRPLLRYCTDWSEQRHHLAGALGATVLESFVDSGWIRRAQASRAVHVTLEGRSALGDVGLDSYALE
ncbi:MAG TPA: helix-turn-helix transcriptional regulator [Mycobacteriales bacterium]|nr:helix-turn-helix transcriptional regulator [Mycobacteriales bacterium]